MIHHFKLIRISTEFIFIAVKKSVCINQVTIYFDEVYNNKQINKKVPKLRIKV